MLCEKVVNSGQFLPIYWRKVINNPKKHQKSSSFGSNNRNQGSGYDDLFTLAFSHHKENNLDKAEELYTACLDMKPKDPLILHNLGVIFLQTGRFDNAIHKFYEAIKYKPKYVDALCNLGIALKNSGKLEEAVKIYNEALAIETNSPEIYSNLGILQQELNHLAEAQTSLKKAVSLDPKRADFWSNLAILNYRLGEVETALTEFTEALKLDPDNPTLLSNFGSILVELGRSKEALAPLNRSLNLKDNSTEVLYNLGKANYNLTQLDKSINYYKSAIAFDPDFAKAHHNMAHALLARGNLRDGWEEYGWRWAAKGLSETLTRFNKPIWQGENISTKKILVWSEQGIGDEILFSSLIPNLKELSAHCILEANPRLVPLFNRSFPSVKVVEFDRDQDNGSNYTEFDFHLPTGDLPKLLWQKMGGIKTAPNYLLADSEKKAEYRKRYKTRGKHLIGLSWASSPPKGIPLSSFSPIFKLPNITFVNLQYGEHSEEILACKKRYNIDMISDPEVDPLISMENHAAQVAAMDAVVSIQNTTIYVSGGLGIQTFAILPPIPDWRWLGKTDKSPWHNSVNLYPRTSEDFSAVEKLMNNVAKDLGNFLKTK